MKLNKNYLLIAAAVVFLIIVLLVINAARTRNSTVAPRVRTAEENAMIDAKVKAHLDSIKWAAVAKPTWVYDTIEDKMAKRPKVIAHVTAKEPLSFDFPYEGTTYARLYIRDSNGELDVFFMISQGQIHNDYSNPTMRVKFDDEEPVSWAYNESSDGSNTHAFFRNPRAFLKKIKESSTVIIESGFYDNGIRQMEFKVDSLIWN